MTDLSEDMRKFAELSRQEPFHTESAGGQALHLAFAAFIEASADDDAQDVLTDFIRITARNILAIHVIQHDGELCFDCLKELASLLSEQLTDDANELAAELEGMAGVKH